MSPLPVAPNGHGFGQADRAVVVGVSQGNARAARRLVEVGNAVVVAVEIEVIGNAVIVGVNGCYNRTRQ